MRFFALLLLWTLVVNGAYIENNNFGGPGDVITNNNVASGSESIVNNNLGQGFSSRFHAFFSPNWPRPHRPRLGHHGAIVNNNNPGYAPSSVGDSTGCQHGSIVNNNGPGDVQVVCLPPGFESIVNNN